VRCDSRRHSFEIAIYHGQEDGMAKRATTKAKTKPAAKKTTAKKSTAKRKTTTRKK
jgi:hypothetical protein